MIESYAQIETNEVPILSAQQVTACTPNPLSCGGTGGCMGSIPQLAFTYIQLFGHVTEDEWPYTAGNGNTGDCEYDYNGMPPSVGLTGYTILDPNNQDAVMQHLAEVVFKTENPLRGHCPNFLRFSTKFETEIS